MGIRPCTIAITVALAVLCGCAQVSVVDPIGPDESLVEVNRALSGRKARIVLGTGSEFLGMRVHVRSDSTMWVPADMTSERVAVQTSELKSITVLDRGRGARRGAILGGATGALGGLFYAAEYTSEGFFEGGFESFAVGTIPIGGVAGAALGAIIGGYVGSKWTFVFGSDERVRPRRRR
jgi:hypothetical protein